MNDVRNYAVSLTEGFKWIVMYACMFVFDVAVDKYVVCWFIRREVGVRSPCQTSSTSMNMKKNFFSSLLSRDWWQNLSKTK